MIMINDHGDDSELNVYDMDGDRLMIMVTEMMMRELKPVFDQRELGEDGTAAPTP